ncbi:MAG: transposase [Desulfobacca sp.]|nr:transposase [Desulfobacca sp.]
MKGGVIFRLARGVIFQLAFTDEGLPVRSWVFPGHTADVTTVKKVKADLRGWQLGRALLVAAAGMNSQDNRQQVIQELEQELSKHATNQATARWGLDLQASGRYKRYLTVDDQGGLRLDRQAIQNAKKYDGKWVLITNDDTISLEDAATGYKGLLVIERCFRTLKSTQIKLTPMYHWLPHRIAAHIKICVFALLLERVAEMTCQRPWSAIQNLLGTLQVSEFQTPSHNFFQRNEISPELLSILKALEIPPPKLVLEVTSTTSKL